MLVAARELLMREGPAGVTHQRVADQSGVGRATVYRHWPRAEQLLLDAMVGVDLPFFRNPAVPVRRWLHQQLRHVADEFVMPEVASVTSILVPPASVSPEMAERLDQFVSTVTERISAALALAVDEGELREVADPQDAVALLIGPMHYRASVQSGSISDGLIDRLIDSIGTWTPST